MNHTNTNYKAIAIIGILFFIFGFISWVNAVLIPYFKLSCQLNTWQAMLVAFAFYISYFIMAIPASNILLRTGFKNGMILGLFTMAFGALLFIPAAMNRSYILFLVGLFTQATGLTILQTASNPYITILGPIESAAKRISIMGICNKVAGAIAPLILINAITKNPDEIDDLQKQLPSLNVNQQTEILNELASRLITPYIIIAATIAVLGLMLKMTHLPDVKEEEPEVDKFSEQRKNILQYPYLILGAVCIFCAVSVEVLAVDTIISYGEYTGLSFKEAKYFASYTLIFMIVGYLVGTVVIPKFTSQRNVLMYSAIIGLIFSLAALFIPGKTSVWMICLLGLANALLWPSIWPLAIDKLGKFTKKGSAILIMGIAGAAVMPLLYGYLSDKFNPQAGYSLLIPCYLFILFYSLSGYKQGKHI